MSQIYTRTPRLKGLQFRELSMVVESLRRFALSTGKRRNYKSRRYEGGTAPMTAEAGVGGGVTRGR